MGLNYALMYLPAVNTARISKTINSTVQLPIASEWKIDWVLNVAKVFSDGPVTMYSTPSCIETVTLVSGV